MATTAELERRLRKVEQAIASLTRAAAPQPADPRSAWYVAQAGAFAGDPVFDEIVELGRKARAAQQRPKPRGRRR